MEFHNIFTDKIKTILEKNSFERRYKWEQKETKVDRKYRNEQTAQGWNGVYNRISKRLRILEFIEISDNKIKEGRKEDKNNEKKADIENNEKNWNIGIYSLPS